MAEAALIRDVRTSGLLLHVTSLPGRIGIGDLGPDAYEWIERLTESGQTWWQMLPLGPTGYGDSPYQALSAFAGNTLLVSPDLLVEDGLIPEAAIPKSPRHEETVDFPSVQQVQRRLADEAWKGVRSGRHPLLRADFESFCHGNADWLDDFSLFAAIKASQDERSWQDWPAPLRLRDAAALREASQRHAAAIEVQKFRQYLFYRQWSLLRRSASARGVRLLGDLPIFVALDSADVWAHPELFLLDDDRRPRCVAGVPPDYFSATGQFWGNPLYDWQAHRATGFAWWTARLRNTLALVDVVRLDHFRGFAAHWEIPAGSPTAENGAWVAGPGLELFQTLARRLAPVLHASHDPASDGPGSDSVLTELPFVAEDLGVITPDVEALRGELRLPGMSILQFAFGGAKERRFLPHFHERSSVVYTGTHDNETTAGWYENLSPEDFQHFQRYVPPGDVPPAQRLWRLAWASVAACAIAPFQDLLGLGNEARMNLPGTTSGNWRWRCARHLLHGAAWDWLADLTQTYERAAPSPR